MVVEFPTGRQLAPEFFDQGPGTRPAALKVSDALRTYLQAQIDRATTERERRDALRLQRLLTKGFRTT